MSNWLPYAPLLVFGGALFGALIGAVAAYKVAQFNANASRRNAELQAHISRQLKIADLRQNWIDKLRDHMSEFQSYGVTPNLDQFTERKFYETGTKIELLMNRTDPDYNELVTMMYGFLGTSSIDEKFSQNAAFVDICQRILKREWEVVKCDINLPFET